MDVRTESIQHDKEGLLMQKDTIPNKIRTIMQQITAATCVKEKLRNSRSRRGTRAGGSPRPLRIRQTRRTGKEGGMSAWVLQEAGGRGGRNAGGLSRGSVCKG